MLELRPNCEWCDKDLPPEAEDACICTYECTFCRDCVDTLLKNVCPNCGGGFVPRPLRPVQAHRHGVNRLRQPPSGKRVLSKYSQEEIETFTASLAHVPPEKR